MLTFKELAFFLHVPFARIYTKTLWHRLFAFFGGVGVFLPHDLCMVVLSFVF
jgi:hypothetical protein